MASSYPCHRQHAKKMTLFSKKGHLHHKGAAEFYKYPWRHSLQSGTSAFHGSCRTSTAKLRSRVSRGGESCMRSFDLLRLSMICVSYARRRLARFRAGERKSRIRRLPSLRSFPIGLCTKECGGSFGLPGRFPSPRNTIVEIPDFTRFSFHKIKNLNILRLSPCFLNFSQDDSQEVCLREC